jgi:hypothetical protein
VNGRVTGSCTVTHFGASSSVTEGLLKFFQDMEWDLG